MGFDLQPFWEAELAVQIHAVVAWLAFFVGCFIFLRRKGSPVHKAVGKAWVVMMGVVALSSFFIHGLRTWWGTFSPLHLLSIFVLGSLVWAIYAIRRGNITAHKQTMLGLFIGGLVVTGLLTFARGLLMNRIFFGGETALVLPAYSELPGGVFGVVFGLVGLVIIGVILAGGYSNRQRN